MFGHADQRFRVRARNCTTSELLEGEDCVLLKLYLVVTEIRPDRGLFQKLGKQESEVSDEAGDFKL